MTDQYGPIDAVVIEFPDGVPTPGGFERLRQMTESGGLLLLDLEFVRRVGDRVEAVEIDALTTSAELDLEVWRGASSNLLGTDDLELLAGELVDGAVALIVVFENRWVLQLIEQWTDDGARLVLDGGLPLSEVEAALDATDHQ